MRALVYVLADGSKTKSYTEAMNSGQDFKTMLEKIAEETHTAPKQKHMAEMGLI